MSDLKQQKEMIRLLMQNELYVGKLYELYAQRFPEKKEFWLIIANDEQNHAKSLKVLGEKIDSGIIFFDESRFTPETVKFSMEFKKRLMIEMQATDYTYLQAISNAYALEQALLESKFFEVFQTDDPEIKNVMNYLMESTKQHIQVTRRAWQEAQRKEVGGE